MTTRCKVKCLSTTQQVSQAYVDGRAVPVLLEEAQFSAVMDGSEENKQFFAYTPSLVMKTGTIKKHFEAGKEYYLDITEA